MKKGAWIQHKKRYSYGRVIALVKKDGKRYARVEFVRDVTKTIKVTRRALVRTKLLVEVDPPIVISGTKIFAIDETLRKKLEISAKIRREKKELDSQVAYCKRLKIHVKNRDVCARRRLVHELYPKCYLCDLTPLTDKIKKKRTIYSEPPPDPLDSTKPAPSWKSGDEIIGTPRKPKKLLEEYDEVKKTKNERVRKKDKKDKPSKNKKAASGRRKIRLQKSK